MYNKSLQPYYSLFDRSPMAAAILDADGLKLEMANDKMLALWDRSTDIIGCKLLEFLPEMAGQRYPEYLSQVTSTQQNLEERNAGVYLNRRGKLECVYMDYSFTPLISHTGKSTGILILATDVTEMEITRLLAAQADRDLRALVMAAPVAMCIYRGTELKIEVVNDHMLNLWQDTQLMNIAELNYVYHNGIPYTKTAGGIRYSYTPICPVGKRKGIVLIAVKEN